MKKAYPVFAVLALLLLFYLGHTVVAGTEDVSDNKILEKAEQYKAGFQQQLETALEISERYEEPARQAYERLLDYIGGEGFFRETCVKAKGEDLRPYYGGVYFDDNHDFVLMLKGADKSTKKLFLDVLKWDKTVIRDVKFSHDELYQLYEKIISKQESNPFPLLSTYGINEFDNCIQVSFKEKDPKLKDLFAKWIGKEYVEMLQFDEETYAVKPTY